MNELQEFDDIVLIQKETKELKLPKIERIHSRDAPKEIKSSTKLPTLRSQTTIDPPQAQTERKLLQQEDFVGQVQRKLRMIMEEQNILEIDQSCQSDGDDFQKKINQNKELLKEARRKQQNLKKQNEALNRVANNFNPIRKPSHKASKNQGSDKRTKESRDIHQQNRGIKKKDTLTAGKNAGMKEIKQTIPKSNNLLKEYNGNKELKEVKSKDELSQYNKISAQNRPFEGRKLSKQFSHKFLSPLQKNEQLFDAIHNYLDNPKRAQQQFSSQKIIKEKNQLLQKLKYYEEKLSQQPEGLVRHKESAKTEVMNNNREKSSTESASHWRKIGLHESHLMDEDTSFDKEVDRIEKYLQRNQKSLQKYVQNQKLLIDAQNARRHNSRDRDLEKKSSI